MNRIMLLLCLGTLAVVTAFARNQSGPSSVRFHFREPRTTVFRVEEYNPSHSPVGRRPDWITAWPEDASQPGVEFGRRVVLQLKPGTDLRETLNGVSLKLARTIAPNFFVLEAADAPTAMNEAQRLATRPEVLVSCPVRRRAQIRLHGAYAARPNDPYFFDQWNFENRDKNGISLGVDLNVREAWSLTRGAGTIIAVADNGVELTHPELAGRAANDLHFNFTDDPTFGGTTNALPSDANDNHSTAVAGLALAEENNHRGMSGMAPLAQLANWKIFVGEDLNASDEQLMDMFQYRSNLVTVQNHSWGNSDSSQLAPTALESVGISNAVAFGRGGRGVVLVRSAGNGREELLNANDDGYENDPRAICVASVRQDGRVASYSNPGACLLVAAPGGDSDVGIFTTDRQGSAAGFNTGVYTNDFADYVFSTEIVGTSFSAPQISGLVALMISANANLTWRDAQQILILSARHLDLSDPDLRTNGAGFRVSHNVGFGVPDAGRAVALARGWLNRPAPATVTLTATNSQSIADDGLRVWITNTDATQAVPSNLASVPSTPGLGPHADVPTATLPLVDAGLATNTITLDLSGKAALIRRGGDPDNTNSYFTQKINRAANAGAAFAIIYNNTNGDDRIVMAGTDFVPIPAVFIGQNQGETLRSYLQTSATVQAQVRLSAIRYAFQVTNTVICEHVGVRVQTDHQRRGDVRIALLSPQGTRSVLQRAGFDDTPGPGDWTYYSTLQFGECSAGSWTVEISDEQPLNTGSVQSVSLSIDGVPILDVDRDGLDDDWEMTHFGSLAAGPQDDPDGDGYSNAREQILGSDPTVANGPFALDVSPWDARLARLSWPAVTNRNYELLAGTNLNWSLTLLTNFPGRFPRTEWFTPYTNLTNQFFRVRAVSP